MMKKIGRLAGALLVCGIGFTGTGFSQQISNHFFGVNAWMPDTIGDINNCPNPPCIKYGKLHKNWQKIEESGATIIRYGGIAPDENKPTKYQYLRIVDSVRLHGMEPILQVPFWNNLYTAQEAADIVQYINITMGRNVKYWIIANEPNLLYNYTTASQIAAYFRPFASAMKQVDPTIKIIGPETASFKQAMVTDLTTPGGPDDITGQDANGNYYLDIYSFHTYPFQSGNHTRSQIPGKLTQSGGFQDNLIYLNGRINAANTYHNRTGTNALKSAVTETNICYTNASTDKLYGVGVNSFIGGQFVAEIFGIALKQKVDIVTLWSAVEGNNITNNGGYIDPSTGKRKPLYYHFQLMAQNFSGNLVSCTDNVTNIKTFACQDSGETKVLIMNMDSSVNFPFTVRLNNSSITTTDPLKINVGAGTSVNYSDYIGNQSTMLLVFDQNGNLIRKCDYGLSTHAAADLPPSCVDMGGLTTGFEQHANEISFDASIFPNPSNGKFIVKINRSNREQQEFIITAYNLMGQKVFERKTLFEEEKEVVDMSEAASGAYIIDIRLKDFSITKKMIVNH